MDPRLTLAFEMYDSCELAADIGTDHAYLPAALLVSGKCKKMILTDISTSALKNAQSEITRLQLSDKAILRCGNGLLPIWETCQMISIMGMGGKTISQILTEGKDHLKNAVLLLSAHTDLDKVRSTIFSVGYHITAEEPCYDSGRFYLFIKAEPGYAEMTDQQIRTGVCILQSHATCLKDYLRRRMEVLSAKLHGLQTADSVDPLLYQQTSDDIEYYRKALDSGI